MGPVKIDQMAQMRKDLNLRGAHLSEGKLYSRCGSNELTLNVSS